MRLTIIAACGALLAGCGVSADEPARPEQVSENPQRPAEKVAEDQAEETKAIAPPPVNVSACLIQDGGELLITPVRAIGTEPFWNAQVEGRCITYSTPDDQKGTRIWTRFNAGPDGGVWVGALDGKPFKLITRLRQGCSDGMSDRSYPLDATLTVRGQELRGCAAPEVAGKR